MLWEVKSGINRDQPGSTVLITIQTPIENSLLTTDMEPQRDWKGRGDKEGQGTAVSGKDRGARLMFRTNQRRRIKNRMRLLPARYLSTGAIFDQVRSNNRTSPINRTHNL